MTFFWFHGAAISRFFEFHKNNYELKRSWQLKSIISPKKKMKISDLGSQHPRNAYGIFVVFLYIGGIDWAPHDHDRNRVRKEFGNFYNGYLVVKISLNN